MGFVAAEFGPEIAALLALAGDGEREFPLVEADFDAAALAPAGVAEKIAQIACPETARAGLYLYFGFWSRAHEVAQEIHTAEGSYWHAILHRIEPDAWNAAYWVRRVGKHPVYAQVGEAAKARGYRFEPLRFIDDCAQPGQGKLCRAVQLAEWQLLFAYCMKGSK